MESAGNARKQFLFELPKLLGNIRRFREVLFEQSPQRERLRELEQQAGAINRQLETAKKKIPEFWELIEGLYGGRQGVRRAAEEIGFQVIDLENLYMFDESGHDPLKGFAKTQF